MSDELVPPAEGEIPSDKTTNDAEQPIGPYQRTDEDLLKCIMDWFKEASANKSETAKKRTIDWQQLAGDQWEKKDLADAKKQRRPALTLNMLQTIIAAVEGEERTNRQELKIYGEGKEDDGAAYGLNRIFKWIMDQCGGEFSLSQMFRSEIVCGEGWVVPDVDYFDDPEGKIKLCFVDDDEMYDDPLGKDPVARDSRYIHRTRDMTEEEIEARWPGKKKDMVHQASADGYVNETDGKGYRDIYSTPNDVKSPKLYDAKKKLWRVLETHWFQIEPGWAVVNEETGLLEEKSPEEFEAMKMERERAQSEFLGAVMTGTLQPVQPAQIDPVTQAVIAPAVMPTMPAQLDAKQRPIKRFYQAFSAYKVLLDKRASPLVDLKRFPYVPARALYDKVKGEWYGLIRLLIDVQRQHNVEQSTIVQLTQLMPKSSWMGPKGSFHNKQEWQEKIAQPGSINEYNSARGKPEQVQTPPIPRHLVDMAFTRPQTMRDISGVNVEMMGQKQGADPGVVLEQRRNAAKTVNAPLFDNYRQSKKEVGMVLLAYVQAFMSPGRRIRVLGDDGPTYVQFTEQMQLGRYDVTVEETNSTINDRIATLNLMQTTLPQMLKAGMPIPPEFIDLLPMAPHIRDAMKRMLAWTLTINGQMPPANWQPGMPVPQPGMPGGPPLAAPPAATEA